MQDEVPLGPPPPPKSAAGAAAMKQAQVLVGPPPPPYSAAGGARTSGEQAELDKQIYVSANGGNADEVTSLLAAGADPDGHKNTVRACAPVALPPSAAAPRPRPCPLRATAPLTARPRGAHHRRSSQDGDTALIVASYAGRKETVQALLDAGADLHATNKVRPPRTRWCSLLLAHPPYAHRCRRTSSSLLVRLHRPHEGQHQRAHGDRASATGRGCRPSRHGRGTPAPSPPPAPVRPCPLLLPAHTPCAHRCLAAAAPRRMAAPPSISPA
jgi:hypothetical protein